MHYKEKIQNYLIKNIPLIIIMIITIVNSIILINQTIFKEKFIPESPSISEEIVELTPQSSNTKIKVDIKGQVAKPGVYELESTSIVDDIINIAGGLKKNATTSNLNLSKKLEDQMVITVYTEAELKKKSVVETISCPTVQIEECLSEETSSIITNDQKEATSPSSSTSKISINHASEIELMTLSGIGQSKAKSIIEYRNTNGQFEKLEDILKVSGIGESIFAQIKDNITL